jgi:hypothetical protein
VPGVPSFAACQISAFLYHVEEDRTAHLETLLEAKDPLLRVAAAIYLCFEDPEGGTQRLWEALELKGAPGAWAALTLARRGNKGPMPRALKALLEPSDDLHLDRRLIVLLSNSAARSGVPQPQLGFRHLLATDADLHRQRVYEYFRDWSDEHRDQIELHDPWLELLEASKID